MTAIFKENDAPPTPPAGYVAFYCKTDGLLYYKDDAGVELPIKPVGGGTGDLLSDGTVPLTANWDVGAFKIIAAQFESDVATGTAPFIVASTTQVDNLTAEWAAKALAVVEPCRNESGGLLAKGTPVYISGYSVGQDLILISAADADAAATMPCIGLLLDDLANNASGYVVTEGDVNGVDTSSFSVGDELYVSGTAGALTATRPTGTALIQEVAIVLRSHATLGVLQVIPGAEVEGLPNLAEDNVWVGDASGTPTATDAAGLRTLLNVEDGATADQSDAEIETAYNNQVAAASQAEMEAGTETAIRRMTPERVAQAIAALSPAGAVEFADNVFRITDNGDATKKVAFEVSAIATATTRTVTMPNEDMSPTAAGVAFEGTKYVGVNDQTGTTYELVLGDAGKLVTMNNASANTLTIPANASVAFAVGTRIDVLQKGAGATTIAITSDTLNGNVDINAQWEVVSLIKIASTTWVVVGGVA